ncbi:unnamed protein product [Meganyctiphanes norvegica]|uniref:Uncharacterized protein n=1 Tax=Meganyctiphanes norvegica TaxID=48144 RepID=A0AAV2RM66_MEGNR
MSTSLRLLLLLPLQTTLLFALLLLQPPLLVSLLLLSLLLFTRMVMFPVAVILAASLTTCVASPDIIVRDERSSQCIGEGRFADPHDCGQFYDCVPSNNGGFKAIHQTCYGHAFHPDRKVCVPLQEVKDCAPYSQYSRTSIDANITHEQLCKTEENEFICSDCKTLVTCVDKMPHALNCGDGHVCSMRSNYRGGLCYPRDPMECTCNGTSTLKRDFYDPSKYFSCSSKNAEPLMFTCPAELIFNEKLSACGPVPTTDRCTEEGGSCVTWGHHCIGKMSFMINSPEDHCACCLTATCDPVCLNDGSCIGPNHCQCSKGWHGEQCQHAICEQDCINGVCEFPDLCNCSQHWSGDQCEQPICDPVCLNSGACVALNICKCQPGHHGEQCQHFDCAWHGGVIIGNQCLFLSEEKLKWNDANRKCTNKFLGRLAVLADANQHNEVVAYLAANARKLSCLYICDSKFSA